jgi:hypothetical protein
MSEHNEKSVGCVLRTTIVRVVINSVDDTVCNGARSAPYDNHGRKISCIEGRYD